MATSHAPIPPSTIDWQARALWRELVAAADDDGLVHIADGDASRVVARLVGIPPDVVAVALVALVHAGAVRLQRNVVALRDSSPVDPAARRREAARARQARARARRRDASQQQLDLSTAPSTEAPTALRRDEPPPKPSSNAVCVTLDPPIAPRHAPRHAERDANGENPPATAAAAESVTLSRATSRSKVVVSSEDLNSPIDLRPSSLQPDDVARSGNARVRELAGGPPPTQGLATRTTAAHAAAQVDAVAVTPTRSGRVYVGRLATSSELHEVGWWRREALADLEPRARARVPTFTADIAELGPGVARALDDYGPDTVRVVVQWAVRETGAGRMSPRHFRALFNGDAFPQRVVEAAAYISGDAADEHLVTPELASAIARQRAAIEAHRAALSMPHDQPGAPAADIRTAIENDLQRDEQRLAELLAASRRPNGARA